MGAHLKHESSGEDPKVEEELLDRDSRQALREGGVHPIMPMSNKGKHVRKGKGYSGGVRR